MIPDKRILLFQHQAISGWEGLSVWLALVLSSSSRRRYRQFASTSHVLRVALADEKDDASKTDRTGGRSLTRRLSPIALIAAGALVGSILWSEYSAAVFNALGIAFGSKACVHTGMKTKHGMANAAPI